MNNITDNLQDSELIKKCLSGENVAAWEVFVKSYSKLIWNSIHKTFNQYSFRHSKEDTEDIYGSVFLSLIENDFKKLRQFRGENACTLRTWLTVITVRMTIDYMRRDKGRFLAESTEKNVDVFEFIPDRRYCSEKLLEEKQTSENLRKSVELLPLQDRMIYDLLYNREVSPEEAAKILGLSAADIYSRKHRIIEKIKKNMKEM
ncbi:MAG: sigma-70 family RNA polymerase sigma factor [Nitrospirae bacterium]|nr:sigma-70 family RNA polymerase sigma factor [Nitrospirota bacterium]